MFITQPRPAVIPLLCITTAYANMFIGQAIEDFPVDSNATIMAFGNLQEACKFMFLDPTNNITCCYSNKAEGLCDLDEQSSSCRNSENAIVTASTNRCQLLLIKVQESDQGSYNISSPNNALNTTRNVQINVTNPPEDLTQNRTLTLMAGGAGFMMLGSVIGIIMVNKYNNLVTVEEAEV